MAAGSGGGIGMGRRLAAMIIGLGLLGPFGQAAAEVRLPSPVEFSVQMELGDLGRAQDWLAAGLPPDFEGSRIGSGLQIGAWEGNLELMRVFLAQGADIDYRNGNGETALLLAAWQGRKAAVEWLLERGAKVNAGDRQWSALHYAVFAGHGDITNLLVERGADIDAKSSNGSSVLMMAIYEGREDLARMLIERGADRSVKNDWGDGALEWAMRGNHLKIARLVTSPEEFNIAVAQPKAKWGEPRRSLRSSKELEELLRMREILAQRNLSTQAIDNRIAAERARIVRSELNRDGTPTRASTLEITASRKDPRQQSASIVREGPAGGKAFPVPSATYSGKPRMPPKGAAKGY